MCVNKQSGGCHIDIHFYRITTRIFFINVNTEVGKTF